ncbi:MAG: Beta-galactosidase C-terminal domain, partial [Bacteroidales bacterium]|nr:Beta-galactosidase C-terminal domain [Bacteroidales bacterium]
WYVGTIAKEEAFYDALVDAILRDAGIEKILDLPAGVEASIRQGSDNTLLFLINHTEEKKTVRIHEGKMELISNSKTGTELELDRYEVIVIKL